MHKSKFLKLIRITAAIIISFFLLSLLPITGLCAEDKHNDKTGEQRVKKYPDAQTFAGVEMVLVKGDMAGNENPESGKQKVKKIAPFWISRHEVTQELYESVMWTNPSYFKGKKLPVESVSWFDAVEFCNKLSIKNGLNAYYLVEKNNQEPVTANYGDKWKIIIDINSDGFRLPTSEEWEYAARAGSNSRYFWGDAMNGDYCWYKNNSDKKTHPVGTKKSNAYGIYDIAGNVREWCSDLLVTPYGISRAVRDGHYRLDEEELQIDRIDFRPPHTNIGFIGIRLVKNK